MKDIKEFFVELISSEDHKIRLDTWDMMRDFNLEFCSTRMIYYGVVEMSDLAEKKEYFIDMLSSKDHLFREKVLRDIPYVVSYCRIVDKNDLADKKKYFIELLSSEDYKTRLNAWSFVCSLLHIGVIEKDDVLDKKRYFFDLLSLGD